MDRLKAKSLLLMLGYRSIKAFADEAMLDPDTVSRAFSGFGRAETRDRMAEVLEARFSARKTASPVTGTIPLRDELQGAVESLLAEFRNPTLGE